MKWNETARLWADFNEIYRGNLLEVDLDFAMPSGSPNLSAGDWVRVYDGEGNECSGLIDHAVGHSLIVKLDLASWQSVSVEILAQPIAHVSASPRLEAQPTGPVRVGG